MAMDAKNPMAKIWELSHGHQLAGSLRAAVEVGLFQALDGIEATSAEIAARTACSERGIRILADALVSLGALEKRDHRYRFAAGLEGALSPTSPGYRGDIVLLATYPALFDAWSHAADAVRHGGSVLPANGLTPGHEFWEAYARITAGFTLQTGLALASALADGAVPERILDVGCGSGMVGVGLLQKLAPGAELVQNDWPNVLAIARQHVELRLGPDARLQQLAGDARTIDLGGPYDLVVISQFLQNFDAATCVAFLTRVRAALKPGGIVAIGETPPDEERQTSSYALLFAMVMLLWTSGGDMYSYSEIATMLTDAGFTNVHRSDVSGTPRVWIIAGG
jgi:ubiquinone/menaquinone biosynthesis C-methylase UbiE